MGILGEFFSSPYMSPSAPRPDGSVQADAEIDAWEGDQPFSAEMSAPDDYAADGASTDLVRDESPDDPIYELRERLRSRPWFRILCDAKLMADESLDAWSRRRRRLAAAFGFGRKKPKGDRCQGCEEILSVLRATFDERPTARHGLPPTFRPMPWEAEADFSNLVEPAGHPASTHGAWVAPRGPAVHLVHGRPRPARTSTVHAPDGRQDLARTLSRFATSLGRRRLG